MNRGLTSARATLSPIASTLRNATTGGGEGETRSGEDLRWAVYNQVLAARLSHTDEEWQLQLGGASRRLAGLLEWSAGQACERWRLIEAWTHAAHGPCMALAGGFRLAFWREEHEHHGPRLEQALRRYKRFVQARPPGWPQSPVAAFATFLARHTPPLDGPEHGMAYDVQRFNELTKRMSAYAHYQRAEHLEHAARRAEQRRQLDELARQVNLRLRFRVEDDDNARLRRASELLNSDHPAHRQAGRALYAAAKRAQELDERDTRLLAGRHPGDADGRYRAACAHAQRWGLPLPPGRRPGSPPGDPSAAVSSVQGVQE